MSSDTLTRELTGAAGAALEVRALQRRYHSPQGAVDALGGVDLSIAAGSFDAVIGPSGCGKSTLLQILAGLQEADAGEVLIDGRGSPDRLGLCAYMPQHDALLEHLRTIDNVALGLAIAGVDRSAARAGAGALLERFGMAGFERAWPWQLSGGMRQRAAFLRTALLGRPAMLLDEPFGALDALTRAEMHAWLLEVWEQVASTVVLVTHDVAEAVFLADRVHVMTPRPGRVCASLDIPLARPRRIELLESDEFAALERRLREELRSAGAVG